MFGSSSFAYKNIRRKADARAYPTRLEFGLKGGLVAPTALNNGEQIELLLGRIASPYSDIDHFDRLPTPFRAVAVDLVSATEVVMDRGSLAQAMRATMSLPLIFPPVERDGRVLVDGGAMNNVPADVVRAMGADRVIAVNVGNLEDREGINYSMSGLAGETLDAMMRASTKASIASADVILDVPLADFGSLDWRRSDDLIREVTTPPRRCATSCCRWPCPRPSTRSGSRTVRAAATGRCPSRPSSGWTASPRAMPAASTWCSSVMSACRWCCRRSRKTWRSSAGSTVTRRSPGGCRRTPPARAVWSSPPAPSRTRRRS